VDPEAGDLIAPMKDDGGAMVAAAVVARSRETTTSTGEESKAMNVTPIYLQASACQLGYTTTFGKVYDEKKVTEYVRTIEERLALVGAPPLKRFLGVGFPEPVKDSRKAGVVNDWGWVSADARKATGVPAGEPLLQRSVSNMDGNVDLKGNMLLAWLHAVEEEVKHGLSNDEEGRPWFVLIDHNAAHHVSAPMVHHGFKHARSGAMRVLVNFDFHADADGATNKGPESIARCDNWAGFMTQAVSGVHDAPVVDASVNFGVSSGFDAKVSGNLGDGKFQFSRDRKRMKRIWEEAGWKPEPPPSVTQQLQWVMQQMGNPLIDFYISCDRDFMIGSYTPWGDGSQEPPAGRAAIREALAYFAEYGAKLVGFDIVGLPAEGGVSKKMMTREGYLDQAYEDIRDLFQAVRDYPDR